MGSAFHIDFVQAEQLLAAPRPDPLIDGFIQEQEAVCLYGDPNGGKSFLALSWALSVASGLPWLDTYEVKRGPVIYMAGEGGATLQLRVHAWMKHHGVTELPGAYFQVRPLPLRDEDTISEIQDVLQQFAMEERGADDPDLQPRLIVVDTLSQFMMGGDEVGPDMALFVSNCRRLSQDNSTAVLIVHHTNAGGERERGHTSLRGNVDVMFKCKPVYEDNVLVGLEVFNDKQRDKARTATVPLRLKSIDLGVDHRGEALNSLVVVPTLASLHKLPTVEKALFRVLEAVLVLEDEDSEKTRHRDIVDATGMSKASVHRRLEKLAALKLIKHREGKSALTTLGRAVLEKAGITREEDNDE